MDIDETDEQRRTRTAFTRWLGEVLPADYGDGSPYSGDWDLRRSYQRAAFEAGWLLPAWPVGLGGRGLGPLEALAVQLESARRSVPRLYGPSSVHVVAPAIRKLGTPEQQDAYLVPMLRGDVRWCLGMSEPGAGSDFAGLQTAAVRVDDAYVVNGQKIWTSQAHWCTYTMLYCRTDRDAPRHRGISCLVVDLRSPGVTVRPIGMATGKDEQFCEVFFDDVVVPVEHLLGVENDGWAVAMSALEAERHMLWIMAWAQVERALHRVVERAGDTRLPDDLAIELGRSVADSYALGFTGWRAVTNQRRDRRSPETSIQKLLGSETLLRISTLTDDLVGADALVEPDLFEAEIDALAAATYGGTSEVQRTIIGERSLGLPK
ncbi:MAG: acyl-CoA dehydrogenase [Actinomycetia bacterium]|nr:acyl-CoA dehydrogenase [Actinomycetes bacterium]